jgi:exoribonuclease R
VPYEVKPGFSKHIKNRYVVFRFDQWTQKHPHGQLAENLGPVDQLDAFYEYQIYCRSLHESIADFNRTTKSALSTKPIAEYMHEIRTNANYKIARDQGPHIFTVDPKGSSDFDDAFSVEQTGTRTCVNIYIANVYVWLDAMGLWRSFSKRVSTIYLPDFRRPMLPTILADSLCSLEQGESRFAFRLSLEIEDGQICEQTVQFQNVEIRVANNYVYESADLIKDQNYRVFLAATQQLDTSIQDSHDAVAFWMIQMNRICGQRLAEKGVGIFRQAALTNREKYAETLATIPAGFGAETKRLISNWNHTTGNYVLHPEAKHEIMGLESYVHITSPIRRLVDLLNQMAFSREYGVLRSLSTDAQTFLENWTKDMDYVNTTMRSIRKVQIDCDVLKQCYAHPEWMQHLYQGVTFDRVTKTDGTYSYMVYLEELRILSRINTTRELANYSKHQFRLFVFEDENKIKNKIRLELVAAESQCI